MGYGRAGSALGDHLNHPMSAVYTLKTDGPGGGKQRMIEEILGQYREGAKAQLLEEFPKARTGCERQTRSAASPQTRSRAMTIQTAAVRQNYIGDGASTVFPIPFEFYTAADIGVYGAGARIASGYTISGGNDLPGAYTFLAAPAVGAAVLLILDPAITQLTEFVDGVAFESATIEQAYDRETMVSKRLRDLIARCIAAPDSDINPLMVLPPAAVRANMGLIFDTNGNVVPGILLPTALTQAAFDIFLAASGLSALVNPVTASEKAASLVPGNTQYVASPYRDPRRDLVTGSALASLPQTPVDDTGDDAGASEFCAQLCRMVTVTGSIPYPHHRTCVEISASLNNTSQGIRVRGVSNVASTFVQNGVSLLNNCILNCAAPGFTTPIAVNLELEDFSIFGQGYTAIALNLQMLGLSSPSARSRSPVAR